MIKLFSKSKQPDSVLPVRWCIPKSSLEKLKEGNIVNPHVLLMITRKGFDDSVVQIDRRIAHMDQAMEYISFARAGVYKIYAALIYPIHGEEVADAKRFRRKFLEIHNGHYYRYVLDSSGDYYKDSPHGMYENDSYHIVDRGLLEVTVSKEFFAAEPSARQQALVNLWHLSRPKDQCAYRRRMLLCIVKLPLALLFYPIRALLQFLLAFAAFMSGMRGVTFRPILHPFGNEFMDVTPDEEKCSCVFLSDADGNRRNRILLAFMPSLWLCVFLAGRIITHSLHKWSYISWRSLLLWSPIVVFAVVTLIILFDRLGEFVVGLSGYDAVEKAAKHEKVKLMRKKAKEDAERRKFEQKFDEYDQYLSCSADTDFVPSVSALPLAKQTLHLRFHDLKARVCKPFAR